MADDAIVFAMANPTPEVLPEEIEGLAAVVATGRSDYPNQINNVLAFPGVFRGALDVRASAINEEMKLAAAEAIAAVVKPDELSPEYVVPSVFNRDVAPAVAAAVAAAAEATGVARRHQRPHSPSSSTERARPGNARPRVVRRRERDVLAVRFANACSVHAQWRVCRIAFVVVVACASAVHAVDEVREPASVSLFRIAVSWACVILPSVTALSRFVFARREQRRDEAVDRLALAPSRARRASCRP